MAKKNEKTLLLALFDCFRRLSNGIVYFEEHSNGQEYIEKLWARKADNWYIVYCGDICVLSLGTRKMSDKVSVGFAQDTMAENVTQKNEAVLCIQIWPALSGKTFKTLARKQELHLKRLIEKGVQLYNSKDNESKIKRDSGRNEFAPGKKTDRRVWDADKLISLDNLEIYLNQKYDFILQLFLGEPYEILCKREELGYFAEIINTKEKKYTHDQILALYTGALLLGLNISGEDKIKIPINKNIEDYLKTHFQEERNNNPQGEIVEVSATEKTFYKLRRFSLQTNLFFVEKKKGQNAIYIEELINKLVMADEEADTEDLYERIKRRVDVVVKGLWQSAINENLSYKDLEILANNIQEEIAQLIPNAESRIRARKNDALGSLKLDMIDALRIYVIILFLHLSFQYGSFLLSQASEQIQKEASIIHEDMKTKDRLLRAEKEKLDIKESELEMMIIEYGGNAV